MTNPSFKSQPENVNLLQTTRYQMVFSRLPTMTFMCQTVILPGLNGSPAVFPTPFVDMQIPGDKAQFDQLTLTFLMDEDMLAWREIYEWMKGYLFPKSFDDYKNLGKNTAFTKNNSRPQYSDGQLTVFTNSWLPNIKFKYIDMFPVSLGAITLSTTDNPDNSPVCDVTFAYQYFNVEKL